MDRFSFEVEEIQSKSGKARKASRAATLAAKTAALAGPAAPTLVDAVLTRPAGAFALLVLGHGAGAGMEHAFMSDMAAALAAEKVAVLRYQFPYMQAGRAMPDRAPKLLQTVRAALKAAGAHAGDLPLFAGGKSMGGRMTSLLQAEGGDSVANVRGLVFYGFPLHPAKKPAVTRAAHLPKITVPMLFCQGTKDALAEPELLRDVVGGLSESAQIIWTQDADHGFAVPKRSGMTDATVRQALAKQTATFCRQNS